MKCSLIWAAALAVAIFAFFVPYEQAIAPDWDVYTTDAGGKPLKNITVREVWKQYSLERYGHEEDRQSDATGHVHFDRRAYRSSLFRRFVGCARQIAGAGAHASCGPSAYLVAFGKGIDTMDWADLNQQMGKVWLKHQSSTLVLRR